MVVKTDRKRFTEEWEPRSTLNLNVLLIWKWYLRSGPQPFTVYCGDEHFVFHAWKYSCMFCGDSFFVSTL